MDATTSSNGTKRRVTPEEGALLLARDLLATVQQHGDIAAEATWQQHAVLILRHGQRFIEQLGMERLLKLQQVCAEMVIKIRLAQARTPANQDDDLLAQYEALMQDVFAPGDEAPLGDEEDTD